MDTEGTFGSSNVQQTCEESFPKQFDEKIVTFRMLYNLIKKHKEYKFQKDTPHESCTCEICETFIFSFWP